MSRLIARIARLPVRTRLTLIAVGAMMPLFAALGYLLYAELHGSVNASINRGLRARASELVVLTQHTSHPVTTLTGGTDRSAPGAFAQLLTRSGAVLDATQGFHKTLLSATEITEAFQRPELIDRGERIRLYAIKASAGELVVVGVSLAQQQSAFHTFNWELLAGLPFILLLAGAVIYVVCGRLLGPIETMRSRAETISAADLDLRLPLPRSVDELHRLASTLNEMLDRLHDGMERERTFVSDASHELRGPLAVLKGELEVALRVNGSRTDWQAAVGSAIEETDRVIELAEDLLVLARTQGTARAPATVNASQLLRDAARRKADAAITVSADAELTIAGDPARLGQALDNLLDNAFRYGARKVELRAVPTGNNALELHVLDDGPGFPPDFLPHAFERFTRADAARGRGGAGLGLAIVDVIARAHGGEVRAVNREGSGADVWLSVSRKHGSD